MNQAGEIFICPTCRRPHLSNVQAYTCCGGGILRPTLPGRVARADIQIHPCKYYSLHFAYEQDRDRHHKIEHERMSPKAVEHINLYLDRPRREYYFVFVPAPSEGIDPNAGIKLYIVCEYSVMYSKVKLLKKLFLEVQKIRVNYDQLTGALRGGMHPDIIALEGLELMNRLIQDEGE